MIASFIDPRAKRIFEGCAVSIDRSAALRIQRMLDAIHYAQDLADLPVRATEDRRSGLHVLSVDARWSIRFRWDEFGVEDVQLVDAHADAKAAPAVVLAPVHPGVLLLEEFLKPLKLTAGKLAKAAGLDRQRIERLIRGETPVTADTALRLGRVMGTSAEFWAHAQARYDLGMARAGAGSALDGLRSLRAL